MGRIGKSGIRNALIVLVLSLVSATGKSQTVLPEVFNEGTVKEQMDFIQEKTRIYDNYRAIREDMFQKLKRNTGDSIEAARREIEGLVTESKSRACSQIRLLPR